MKKNFIDEPRVILNCIFTINVNLGNKALLQRSSLGLNRIRHCEQREAVQDFCIASSPSASRTLCDTLFYFILFYFLFKKGQC